MTPDDAKRRPEEVLLLLEQLTAKHTFATFLSAHMQTICSICRENHDLRKAVERLLSDATFDVKSGRFRISESVHRRELFILTQFFDYLYFASDEFLAEVR